MLRTLAQRISGILAMRAWLRFPGAAHFWNSSYESLAEVPWLGTPAQRISGMNSSYWEPGLGTGTLAGYSGAADV